MIIDVAEKKRLQGSMAGLKADRRDFWVLWRELANYYIPKRYSWLESEKESRKNFIRNPFILDSSGTTAGRVLAAGLMNGITSPSRPWLQLGIPGFDDENGAVAQWLAECARRMLYVMSISNFYNAMATIYLDLVFFGTAGALIYEDDETYIHLYNSTIGEYYLGMSHKRRVNTFAREVSYTARQLVDWFGEANVSETVRNAVRQPSGTNNRFTVSHLIEPNDGKMVNSKFGFRETYWLTAGPSNEVLSITGFNELPGIFPRWEVTGTDAYGTSPAMDALPDVIQLQQETKRKAQGIDKSINPPIVADIQLQHRPTALMPNGITYVAGANNVGAKPIYQITPPLQELSSDISDVRIRIQEIFHNQLFNMISQLETVRSATEIDARREEKLVLLGSVLERFENEALTPAVERIFAIMERKGMFEDPPPEVAGQEIGITYISILAVAQRAVAAAPVERWLQLIGNISGVAPIATTIPKWDELIRNYGIDIGVDPRNMNTREEAAEIQQQAADEKQGIEAAQQGLPLVQGAKTLSETQVGGGGNALQQLLAAQ